MYKEQKNKSKNFKSSKNNKSLNETEFKTDLNKKSLMKDDKEDIFKSYAEGFDSYENTEQNAINKIKESQSAINDMVDYQNNQFNPSYYIGTGRVSPDISVPGNPLPAAIGMIFQAIVLLVVYIIISKIAFFDKPFVEQFILGSDKSTFFGFLVFSFVFLGSVALAVLMAVKYFKKYKKYKELKENFEKENFKTNTNKIKNNNLDNNLEKFEKTENKIAQITCPNCGKKHDIDYYKCPYCNYSRLKRK